MRIILNNANHLKKEQMPMDTPALRLTKPRQLILQIITESKTHLDVQEIWQCARQKDMKISMATVYRTVKLLERARLITEHSLGQDHSHYEAASENAHYHFTCLGCGKVQEFSTSQPQSIAKKLNETHGILIKKIHLLMEGYCRQCSQITPLTQEMEKDEDA